MLDTAISAERGSGGQAVDVIITGDFNRYDQLWEGNDVSLDRQGEANLLIDLMNEHSLKNLLPREKRRGRKDNTSQRST